jgi:hypothetical protein
LKLSSNFENSVLSTVNTAHKDVSFMVILWCCKTGKNVQKRLMILLVYKYVSGFDGLVASMLIAEHPRSRVGTRTKPSDFSGEKILSMPSFGGEVKPSFPCRSSVAC